MQDWRLQGQEKFLRGAWLQFKAYAPTRADWDHDHCAFCSAKFSTADGDLHEGYCSAAEYHWVCVPCFEDFKERFGWLIVPQDPNAMS